jgi:hypothetical protein
MDTRVPPMDLKVFVERYRDLNMIDRPTEYFKAYNTLIGDIQIYADHFGLDVDDLHNVILLKKGLL